MIDPTSFAEDTSACAAAIGAVCVALQRTGVLRLRDAARKDRARLRLARERRRLISEIVSTPSVSATVRERAPDGVTITVSRRSQPVPARGERPDGE